MSFPKGKSPNPDGRRVEAAVRHAARAEAKKSIEALAAVRDNPAAPIEVKASAAMQIIALAHFKGSAVAVPIAALAA